MTTIKKSIVIPKKETLILLGNKHTAFELYGLSKPEVDFINIEIIKHEKKTVKINQLNRLVFILLIGEKKSNYLITEALRKAGAAITNQLNDNNIKEVTLVDLIEDANAIIALAEGIALSNYQFLKYKKNAVKETNTLKSILINSKDVAKADIDALQVIVDAVYKARTLVNEPASFLTAVQLSKEFIQLGKEAGFKVEVFNKAKIEALKMGGLLAVNKGSVDPPTFTVMEWKPKNSINKQPILLVGKGVVYDTGGLSLKPTLNSMDQMKCDMAGAAAVACALYAVARVKLPLHVIALVPATDNRPGGNAYAPGDVITMMSGLTVEMLNADAEGRMILADALHYAKRFNPELLLEFSTLTGAAAAAIGPHGIVTMGTADEDIKNELKDSGCCVYERLAELPFWDEYDDAIKSDIADIKNVGGNYGGAITAGKFLTRFTDYPFLHFDIAGPAFLTTTENWRTKGGTGVGVRLLFDYLKKR